MRHRSLVTFCLFLFVIVIPGLASAAAGYTTGNVNMRAGPSTAYPVVTTVPTGAPVQIVGCVGGWSWCVTVWASYRGWVSGTSLNGSWQGQVVPFTAYAPRIGVPVVVYDADVYWRHHYIGRPHYSHVRAFVGPGHACVRGRRGNVAWR